MHDVRDEGFGNEDAGQLLSVLDDARVAHSPDHGRTSKGTPARKIDVALASDLRYSTSRWSFGSTKAMLSSHGLIRGGLRLI